MLHYCYITYVFCFFYYLKVEHVFYLCLYRLINPFGLFIFEIKTKHLISIQSAFELKGSAALSV